MRQDNKANTADSCQDREHERSSLVLVVLLLVIVLATSSLVGYILGRNSGPAPLGQVIDTILLTPEKRSEIEAFHLTGRIFYTDGTPAAGRTLELHSDPVTAVSDSAGGFLFPNIPQGEHTIYVLDGSGSVALQRDIEIVRSSEARAVAIDLQDNGKYVLELSLDIRALEIEIELDAQSLNINPERITYATYGGLVTTPAGTASVRDGAVVTPGGNVYLPDGTIVLPGGAKTDPAYLIEPTENVLMNQPVVTEGISVAADGTVTLPDGAVIEPGGTITPPGEAPKTPGPGGAIVSEGTVIPIGGQDGENTLPGGTDGNSSEALLRPDDSTAPDGGANITAPSDSENGPKPWAVRKKPALRRRTKRGLPRRSAHLIPQEADQGAAAGSAGDGGSGNSGGGNSGGSEDPGGERGPRRERRPQRERGPQRERRPQWERGPRAGARIPSGSETLPSEPDSGVLQVMNGKTDGARDPWEKKQHY